MASFHVSSSISSTVDGRQHRSTSSAGTMCILSRHASATLEPPCPLYSEEVAAAAHDLADGPGECRRDGNRVLHLPSPADHPHHPMEKARHPQRARRQGRRRRARRRVRIWARAPLTEPTLGVGTSLLGRLPELALLLQFSCKLSETLLLLLGANAGDGVRMRRRRRRKGKEREFLVVDITEDDVNVGGVDLSEERSDKGVQRRDGEEKRRGGADSSDLPSPFGRLD